MARKQTFLIAAWSEAWKENYLKLSAELQAACGEGAIALIKQVQSAGLRIKPIHPDKYKRRSPSLVLAVHWFRGKVSAHA
jgi:hypothetical protein